MVSAASGLDLSDLDGAEAELSVLADDWGAAVRAEPSTENRVAHGQTLQALGIVRRQLGKPTEALADLEESVALLASSTPGMRADATEALALTLQDLGRLDESEARLREVLSVREQSADPSAHAQTLDHLAMVLLVKADYGEVHDLLDRALAILPATESDSRARILGHLSRYHHTLGSHARSIDRLKEALALEFDDPELRLSLRSQLALSRLRLGESDAALSEMEAISRDALATFSDRPLAAAPYLNNLGTLSLTLGRPAEASETFDAAIQLIQAKVGPHHPGLITPLNNLGVALLEVGDVDGALSALGRCADLQEEFLDPVHLRVAETRRNIAHASLLAGLPDGLDRVDQATGVGLKLLEELVQNGTERERLNFLARFDLVSLPCSTGDPARIADVLIASKGRLLDTLLGTPSSSPPSRENIIAALPGASAFVDVTRYIPIEGDRGATYGAVLYLPDQDPRWIPLGTEEALLRWLGALRERLDWKGSELGGDSEAPPTLKLPTILRALYREFWKPIEEQLPPGTEHIAWSADAATHFIPMAALLDERNIPLCHKHWQLTHIAHAREMVAAPPTISVSDHPWSVITISDFPKPPPALPTDPPLRQLLATLSDMPGTEVEAKRLRKLAPRGSHFISNHEARESALRGLSRSPAVLHLGCHAFFLANPTEEALGPIDFDDHSELLQAGGLVLYEGARHSLGVPVLSPTDDIVFPAEIAKLPLKDTRLVTLSSCDSGSGTPVSGEGLLGLRRAFHLAGATDVAVALWPVSDASAPRFMEKFYRRTIASDRPGQALWETQRELIPKGDDPGFEAAVLRYAPFVLSQTGPLLWAPPIGPAASPPLRPLLYSGAAVLALTLIAWLRIRRCRRKSSSPKAKTPQ